MGEGEEVWVEPGLGSTAAFVAIVVAVGVLVTLGMRATGRAAADGAPAPGRSTLGTALFFVAVLGASAAYVGSGLIRQGLPAFMAFFAVSNLTAVLLALSPIGRRLSTLSAWLLIAPHALRLPLELVLHAWADGGTIPPQMTFEGHNFDIVTGVMALGLAAYGRSQPLPRPAVWIFNVVGTALLVAVMSIALLSSPVPFASYEGPPLTLVFHLPYAWILPMCVSPALFGHLILFRKLLGTPATQPS